MQKKERPLFSLGVLSCFVLVKIIIWIGYREVSHMPSVWFILKHFLFIVGPLFYPVFFSKGKGFK